MSFDYSPLWKLLIDKKLTRNDLRNNLGLSPNTIARMGKGGYVSMEVLDRICNHLKCSLSDIVEHVPTKE